MNYPSMVFGKQKRALREFLHVPFSPSVVIKTLRQIEIERDNQIELDKEFQLIEIKCLTALVAWEAEKRRLNEESQNEARKQRNNDHRKPLKADYPQYNSRSIAVDNGGF